MQQIDYIIDQDNIKTIGGTDYHHISLVVDTGIYVGTWLKEGYHLAHKVYVQRCEDKNIADCFPNLIDLSNLVEEYTPKGISLSNYKEWERGFITGWITACLFV